jgi:hypothetical protein
MKRTSSEGKALDEHPTKDETNYTHTHKAKSHVSNCCLDGEKILNTDLTAHTYMYNVDYFGSFIVNLPT